MEKHTDPSLVEDYRNEFAGRFSPLKLWNDRRRILADPAIAAKPQPPLANSPVRFALSLQLVPIIFIGWLVGSLAGLIAPDRDGAGLFSGKLVSSIALMDERLGPMPDEQLKELAGQAGVQHMHPAAEPLWMDLVRTNSLRMQSDAAQVHASTEDWLQRLDASEVSPEHRMVLTAKGLRFMQQLQASEKWQDGLMRSMTEGGVLMQVIGVGSLLFSAWLLGQMLRGNAWFPLATRADRFYLYYSTSHIFWFLLVKLLFFGVGSFAYAAGNTGLFSTAQTGQLLVAGATAIWLLSRSGEMARVLSDASPAPKGAAFAVAWRMAVAMLVSTFVMFVIAVVMGVIAGFAMAMLRG